MLTRSMQAGVKTVEEQKAEIKKLRADLTATRALLVEVEAWTHVYGAALCPGGRPDTFGEGMREAKGQVKHIIWRVLSEDT